MRAVYCTARELARETRLSYGFIIDKCNSAQGRSFAKPTKTDERGRCTGKFIINKNKFLELLERGYLTD